MYSHNLKWLNDINHHLLSSNSWHLSVKSKTFSVTATSLLSLFKKLLVSWLLPFASKWLCFIADLTNSEFHHRRQSNLVAMFLKFYFQPYPFTFWKWHWLVGGTEPVVHCCIFFCGQWISSFQFKSF